MAGILAQLAERGPGQPALADDHGAMLNWTDLDQRVNQWMSVLREHGLRAGDRVALVTGNRLVTFEVLLACLHSGLVAVPVSWRLTASEIGYLLADSGASALVTEPGYAVRATEAAALSGTAPRLAAVLGDTGVAGLASTEKLMASADPAEPPGQCSGSVMLYTSATTGRPKGVLTSLFSPGASLGRITRTTAALGETLGIPHNGRSLLVGPWYHAAQLFFSLFPLLRGCTVVMRHRFDPAATLRDLDHERITLCHMVPTQFIRLLALDARTRAAFTGGRLQRVWHGGAACPSGVKRAMIDWWGPVLVEYYGATEAGIVTVIDSAEWLDRPGSVGRPLPPTEVLVVGEDGTECPPGVSGQVYVRRPAQLDFEYHNAPGKTEAAHLRPGVFTVGDLGRLDPDGYLYLTGRTLDTIISGGVNIYPAEIEAVLLDHPAVRDAAVIGIPDEEFGERVLAVIEPDAGVEPDPGLEPAGDLTTVLDAHCRKRLADYKRPRAYRLVSQLGREPSGKLDKRALRAPFWKT
ncbi:MAG: AMP-binding protein [Streptosporangiaceae bacterium]|nr:AMP-binding protein [Streptosporangiaceae bacterium]